MKIQYIYYCFFLIIIISCKSYSGKYVNGIDSVCPSKLQLNKDGTYLFDITYGHMCGHSWSYGYWDKKKDTLYFTKKILHDTLRFTKDNVDTLVLSKYPTPELKVYDTLYQLNITSYLKLYNAISLSSPRQSPHIFPKAKLIIKKNKLYELDYKSGKISGDYFIVEKIKQKNIKK